jgi:2-polyprenyl-3-methyl-5-hydroxy-6-metoxy-1,4-benzoquinol methylase
MSRSEAEHFDRLAAEEGHAWWGNDTPAGPIRQDVRATLARTILGLGPGTRVLELGCGAGDFSTRLAASGAHVVGVDISPRLVQLARERARVGNVSFRVGNANRLEFEDGTFDAVTGNAILHHLELPAVCAEMLRLLRPGAAVFFAEPNMLNPQVWIERNVRLVGRWLQNSPDETAFVRWRLAHALRQAGFVDVTAEPFDFLHPATPAAWIVPVQRVATLLERIPIVREIAGSLKVVARKPRR